MGEGGTPEDFEASWAEIRRRRIVERVIASDNPAEETQARRMREAL